MKHFDLIFKRKLLLLWFLTCSSFVGQGQFVIQYPTPAQGITVCLDTTLLTVHLDVVANTSNDTVFVKFPQGISYMPGSIAKTGGTSSLGISEVGGTPEAPKFVITPVKLTPGQNITFTIRRYANCNARFYAINGGIFKDAVTVKGSAGVTRESESTLNPYNVNYPSITFIQPDVVNNTVPGGIYSRNFIITNGSAGCAGKVYFYIVYPNADLELQSLTLEGNIVEPTSAKGDTLFYTINGTALTSDGLLCNGENLVFTENFKVKKCNSASTTYLAGWGSNSISTDWCQSSGGQGAVSSAVGVPAFTSISRENIGFVDKCTPFDYLLTLSNGGIGDAKAATMFDITIKQGQNGQDEFLNAMDTTLFTFNNVRVGTLSVPFKISKGIMSINLKNLFTSDPDGAGGLTDMDGDGYYDDLPGGQSVQVRVSLKFNCSIACNTEKSHYGFSAAISYHTLCDTISITSDRLNSNLPLLDKDEITEEQFLGKAYVPSNINDNIPFKIKLDAGYYVNTSYYDGVNTRYRWKVVLPLGVTVSGSGNPTYGSTPVAFTQVGDTIIYTSSTNVFNTFSIDLVYNCTNGGDTKSFNYTLEKIQDITTACKCQGDMVCATVSTVAFCPNSCAAGPTTYIPIIRRTDGSLGWTDANLTTRQNAAAISAFDLSKALYLDTIQINGSARQNNPASNLHLELKLLKTTINPLGLNKLAPISATVNIYRGGILINTGILNIASQTNSTATMQSIDWDISSLLPSGGLLAGDSIYTLSKYQVSTNNGLPQNDIQSGDRWAFYNLRSSGGRDECNFVVPEMYLVGTYMENRSDSFDAAGCSSVTLGDRTYYLARRFNTSGVMFKNEYRPVIYVDSVALDMPVGYEFISAKFQTSLARTPILMTPTSIKGQVYTFTNPGTWKNLPITVANDYGGFITVEVRPNCATQPVENINVKTYIQDFYYAYAGRTTPPGMTVILEGPSGKTDPIYNAVISKPDILISDQTGLVQAAAPTESWLVRLSSVGTTTAPYTWFGIPDKSGVSVTEVKDVESNSILAPIPYPGGNWYKLSVAGISSGTSKDYRISFNYTSSVNDSLKILAGWNCGGFPTNPGAYPCGVDSLWLKFAPVISEIEIITISEPVGTIDLCVPANFGYVVNCSQAGNTVNNAFSIKVPQGLFPVDGSFEAEYPLGAENWAVLSPTISGNIYTYNLSEHPAYPVNTGLPGTLNAATVNHRQIGVRFKTSTDCDFLANTNFILNTTANLPSGKAATGSLVSFQGPPISITGVNPVFSTINSLTSSDLNNCSSTATIRVQSIIVGGITDNTSTLIIDLPVGLELVPNSLSCSSDVCLTLISSILQPDNKTLLTFRIPSGIDAGSIIQFQIDVKYNSLASCGINTIDLRTEDQLTGISCPSAPGGVCKSLRVETGIGSTTININKPALTFTSLTGNVTTSQGELESYNVDFALNNVGTANLLAANPLTIDFYCADGSGNAKGSILSTYTNATNLISGNTLASSYTFKAIENSPAGELVAVVSAGSNCICSQVLQKYHANVIPLANDDNAITHEGTPIAFNIIVNDTDADGAIDPSTIDLDTMTPGKQTNRTIAEQGTFAVNTSTGDLTFSPLPNFVGAVTPISYQVCDNGVNSMCGQANITVTVLNNAPIANSDVITTLEDTPVSGSVIENDISNGTGSNTWSLIGAQGGCAHGIVSMNSDGNFTYSPDANYFGLDAFSYKLCDFTGDCSQATVTITVNPVNDPPEAIADNFETKENQQLGGNILSNDSDNEGDQLILNVNPFQNTSNGTLILTANGDFIYKPIIDFIGTDSFIYQICDNGVPSLCSTATVTILVTKDESCEVFVPNSFSPDGDGIHDNFKIRCLYNYENPIIEIYNRWGNLVYEKDHYGNVDYWGSEEDAWWNGRSDHKMNIGNGVLPVGTYYYILKLNNTKVLTGFLFLNK